MEQKAQELFQQYVDGWRENNIEKIVAPLSNDCVVIESHGPTYRGIEQVRKWFDYWTQENGGVVKWNVNSFYFLEKENIAFFEWDFACNVSGKDHELSGVSLVKFSGDKISFLHEYRMTKEPYDWIASRLNPELIRENQKIPFEQFKEIELKVGEIVSAQSVEGSEKLLRLKVSLGQEERQILAGIAKQYTPEELIGKHIVIVANLEPKQMMGEESQGMLLAADTPDGPVLLTPEKPAPPGASVR